MENGDPKTADWPLIATPWLTVAFVAACLFIVKVGPKIMERRKAYILREVLIVYNFALVLLSAGTMYELVASALNIPNFHYLCEPTHYVRDDAKQNGLACTVYIYWLSKFVESLDTFFFILRKKNNQVTFLHVYLHASMCLLWWVASKYLPGPITDFGSAINYFVHVVMYAYYGLAAIGLQMQPYLWWKAHIIKLQLVKMALNSLTITSRRIVESLRSITESGDPKTADWPLVATPWPTVAFVAAYLFIVKVGPKIMETRRAYNLREVLLVYNFSLVLLSAWMTYELIASVMDIPNFDFICESIPYIRGDEKQNRLARVIYVYWLSKFVEALETVFFILRKKNNQVSFLHVYHHTTMFFIGWTGAKWLPGGVTFFGTALNSFVHTVMYAYYGLSAIGPHMRPYLWWKRYITKLQLMQFAVLLIYTVNALRINCFSGIQQSFPIYVILVFEITLVVLFINFYIQAYLKKNEVISNNENYKLKID